MNEEQPERLRSAIDRIALQVAGADNETDLQDAIAQRAADHMSQLLRTGRLSEADVDRVTQAIVKGVLRRLEEIAIGGGKIGSA